MLSSLFARSDYPTIRECVYLNQASLGLIGRPADTAIHPFIDDVARHGNLSMSDSDEVAYSQTLRERIRSRVSLVLSCGPGMSAVSRS